MKIDLNLFTVFEAIYSEGSLTRAAARLNLTQPAISHALARLRDRLNDPLFVRQGHKMQPTAFAKNLMPEVKAALKQLNNALQSAHEFDPNTADKTFRIAMRDLIEATLLPQMIQKIAPANNNIKFASVAMERKDMVSKLANGEYDFVVDVLLPTPANIQQQKIIGDELVVLVNGQHHPHTETLSQTDYLNAQHILVSTRPSGPGIVDYALSALGLKRNIALRCQHYFAACQVVASSDLLLTMPKHYANILCAQMPALRMLDIPFETPNIDIYLYWHNNQHSDAAHIWFRDFITTLQESA